MLYDVLGSGDPRAETVVLSAGLGGLGNYWRPQIEALGEKFRVVVYDHVGTGNNKCPIPSKYTIEHMAEDVIAMLDDLQVKKCHFIGHALGGIVGLDVALRKPSLLDRLVLVNAWSKADVHTGRCFSVRMRLLSCAGVDAYLQAQAIFLYPATWLSENAVLVAQEEQMARRHFQGVETITRRIKALLAFDASARLAEITVPTLVAASRDDILVPWTCSRSLATKLPNSELFLAREGGHAFNVTRPALFNSTVLRFLSGKLRSQSP